MFNHIILDMFADIVVVDAHSYNHGFYLPSRIWLGGWRCRPGAELYKQARGTLRAVLGANFWTNGFSSKFLHGCFHLPKATSNSCEITLNDSPIAGLGCYSEHLFRPLIRIALLLGRQSYCNYPRLAARIACIHSSSSSRLCVVRL